MITCLCAIAMIFLAIRFNNSGISEELGALSDYNNFAFIALLGAAVLALCFSICGICICKIKNKCVTICFGCTLLPVALAVTIFGTILTGVSHSDESDL